MSIQPSTASTFAFAQASGPSPHIGYRASRVRLPLDAQGASNTGEGLKRQRNPWTNRLPPTPAATSTASSV